MLLLVCESISGEQHRQTENYHVITHTGGSASPVCPSSQASSFSQVKQMSHTQVSALHQICTTPPQFPVDSRPPDACQISKVLKSYTLSVCCAHFSLFTHHTCNFSGSEITVVRPPSSTAIL